MLMATSPAAVAGRIYRELNSRFGAPTNLQIALTRNSNARNKGVDPKVAQNKDEATADVEESDETSNDTVTKVTSLSAKTTTITPLKPRWCDSSTPANSRVRRVLMPIQ